MGTPRFHDATVAARAAINLGLWYFHTSPRLEMIGFLGIVINDQGRLTVGQSTAGRAKDRHPKWSSEIHQRPPI
jgi:hypothetical protein